MEPRVPLQDVPDCSLDDLVGDDTLAWTLLRGMSLRDNMTRSSCRPLVSDQHVDDAIARAGCARTTSLRRLRRLARDDRSPIGLVVRSEAAEDVAARSFGSEREASRVARHTAIALATCE